MFFLPEIDSYKHTRTVRSWVNIYTAVSRSSLGLQTPRLREATNRPVLLWWIVSLPELYLSSANRSEAELITRALGSSCSYIAVGRVWSMTTR